MSSPLQSHIHSNAGQIQLLREQLAEVAGFVEVFSNSHKDLKQLVKELAILQHKQTEQIEQLLLTVDELRKQVQELKSINPVANPDTNAL